jgi:hypothetical protein
MLLVQEVKVDRQNGVFIKTRLPVEAGGSMKTYPYMKPIGPLAGLGVGLL